MQPRSCSGAWPRQQKKGWQRLEQREQDTALRARGRQGLSPLLGTCQTPPGSCLHFRAPVEEEQWQTGGKWGAATAFPARRGCRTRAGATERSDSFRVTQQQPMGWRRCSQALHQSVWLMRGLETAGTCWNRGNSSWRWARNFSPARTALQWSWGPDRLCHLQLWRLWGHSWVKPWAAWSELRAAWALGRAQRGDLPRSLPNSVVLLSYMWQNTVLKCV